MNFSESIGRWNSERAYQSVTPRLESKILKLECSLCKEGEEIVELKAEEPP